MIRENVEKLADYIERQPESMYDQGQFGDPDCGTPGCLAGHCYVMTGQDIMVYCGLTKEENYGLIRCHPLPDEDGPPSKADAVRTLRRFAKTGVVDWSRETET